MNQTDEIDRAKLFRIYRDVRFSKNKIPFKTHFGLSFNRKKPHLRGGYYIHIAPETSFLAAGFWNPSKEDLLRIRKELGLYTNIRPIKLFDELLSASSIKEEILRGADILFFRE